MSKQSSDLWSKVDAVVKHGNLPRVEPGIGFTHADYAKRYKVPDPTARMQVKNLAVAGKIKLIGKRERFFVYDVC